MIMLAASNPSRDFTFEIITGSPGHAAKNHRDNQCYDKPN
jgi:hypothetical protein